MANPTRTPHKPGLEVNSPSVQAAVHALTEALPKHHKEAEQAKPKQSEPATVHFPLNKKDEASILARYNEYVKLHGASPLRYHITATGANGALTKPEISSIVGIAQFIESKNLKVPGHTMAAAASQRKGEFAVTFFGPEVTQVAAAPQKPAPASTHKPTPAGTKPHAASNPLHGESKALEVMRNFTTEAGLGSGGFSTGIGYKLHGKPGDLAPDRLTLSSTGGVPSVGAQWDTHHTQVGKRSVNFGVEVQVGKRTDNSPFGEYSYLSDELPKPKSSLAPTVSAVIETPLGKEGSSTFVGKLGVTTSDDPLQPGLTKSVSVGVRTSLRGLVDGLFGKK